MGSLSKALHLGSHITHHGTQIDLNLLQPQHQRAHGTVVALIGLGAQIASRHIGRKAAGFFKPGHAAAMKAPQHKHAARHQTGCAPAPGGRALPAQHVGQQNQQRQHRQQPRHACNQAHILAAIPEAHQTKAAYLTGTQAKAGLT